MTPSNPSLPSRSATPGSPAQPGGAPGPGPSPVAEHTHPCARCGAPVAQGVGLCERCNPLGLRDSAASQVHGTVFGVVALAIILLLVAARLSIAGSGPYPATVDTVTPTAGGLSVTLTVSNDGTDEGQTTCRLVDVADRGLSRSAFVLSPRIAAGETVSFTTDVTEFGPGRRELAVTCRTP